MAGRLSDRRTKASIGASQRTTHDEDRYEDPIPLVNELPSRGIKERSIVVLEGNPQRLCIYLRGKWYDLVAVNHGSRYTYDHTHPDVSFPEVTALPTGDDIKEGYPYKFGPYIYWHWGTNWWRCTITMVP